MLPVFCEEGERRNDLTCYEESMMSGTGSAGRLLDWTLRKPQFRSMTSYAYKPVAAKETLIAMVKVASSSQRKSIINSRTAYPAVGDSRKGSRLHTAVKGKSTPCGKEKP